MGVCERLRALGGGVGRPLFSWGRLGNVGDVGVPKDLGLIGGERVEEGRS